MSHGHNNTTSQTDATTHTFQFRLYVAIILRILFVVLAVSVVNVFAVRRGQRWHQRLGESIIVGRERKHLKEAHNSRKSKNLLQQGLEKQATDGVKSTGRNGSM